MTCLGFVGTGTITAAMVRGLKTSDLQGRPILLSPRNAAMAAELASGFAGVSVAADNQAVVDGAQTVFLAIRPQIAEDVIRPLRFRPGQSVVSLVAGLQLASLRDWIGPDVTLTRAVPLPFVAQRQGVTPIYPPNADMALLFNQLGCAIEVDTVEAYDTYAAASALMGSYFGIIELATGWMCRQGLAEDDSAAYLRGLFHSLGNVLASHPDSPAAQLRAEHSTRGGLNELAFQRFVDSGGESALTEALGAVLDRVTRQRLGFS